MSAGETSTGALAPLPSTSEEAQDKTVDDTSFASKLLHPPPLDQTNSFLSPSASPSFDVDEFLLSRAPGSTLKEIATDLQDYNFELKNQLNVVVDRDFKGFVSLGAALKAEGPRIARLDWKVTPTTSYRVSTDDDSIATGNRGEGDEEWNKKLDTPRGSGGNLGLDKVRSEVVNVRDQLRKAEEDVRQVIRGKEEAEIQKANLMLLLSLNDSLRRLEVLLFGPTDEYGQEEASSEEDLGNDQTAKYWQAFSNVEEYDDSDTDDSDSSEAEQVSDAKHQQNGVEIRRSPVASRRVSSSLMKRQSSTNLDDIAESKNGTSSNKLNLPSRIARASSEHAALLFLRERATSIGFTAFVAAHEVRWTRVRELLKDDLRKLIKALTLYQGSSLLVGKSTNTNNNSYFAMSKAELDSWTSNSSTTDEKKVEQTNWLESALKTWCDLPPTDASSKNANGVSEVEEAIRESLVSRWSRETITVDALSKRSTDPKTPKTPFGFGQGSFFEGQKFLEEVDIPQIPQDIVEYSEDDAQAQSLIRLYNEILTFVTRHCSTVYHIAEQIIDKRDDDTLSALKDKSSTSPSHCDIYVRVVWEEIATRLMEQLGGQLFFAGRPDIFHRNYTISMEFLSLFETLAPSDRARESLHQHSSYLTFRKRWQLTVYFQIRLRDRITRLEKALTSSSGSNFGVVGVEQRRLPLMTATGEALALFLLPWKRGMHVMELANRQWRLSLQVLARYRNWIEEELPSDIVLVNRRVLESAKGSGRRSSHDVSRNASPSRAGTPTGVDPENEDALVSTFTVIAADLIWLGNELLVAFEKDVAQTLIIKQGSQSIINLLRQTLQDSLAVQNRVIPLLSTRVTSILKSRCAEPLRLVRSLSTQYRVQPSNANNSSSTTMEPSSFVIHFLRPIRLYLGKSDGKSEARKVEVTSLFLDRHTRSQWMNDVIEDFVTRYAASLRLMNKNYESLRRLRKGNTAGSSTSSTMNFGSFFNRTSSNSSTPTTNGKVEEDVEARRMHEQMCCDVEWLEKEVQDLDLDIQTAESLAWRKLKEAARGQDEE